MSYAIIFVFCVILSNTYQTQSTDEPETTASLQTTAAPETAENATAVSRALSWSMFSSFSSFSNKISELLVVKKNVLAAYPLQLASTLIDKLCSNTLFMTHVPAKFTPDISKMHFQYITSCQNYSVPLMKAEQLWQHMSFNKKRKVVILATGWTNTVNDSSTLALLSKAFLCRKDVNFIIVDAAYYVDTLYKWAALNTEEIGEYIAKGLRHLIKVVPLKNIHLVGHSLGAHIMGKAGRTFTKLTGKKIPRITGLDPAKPCFYKNDTLYSLRRGDADFVDVIHTNIGILAKKKPLGDIDFYPGGANSLPPGCLTVTCAHIRAVEYFAESVYPGNAKNFIGLKCADWNDLKKLNCPADHTSPMGYAVDKQAQGIYYVPVNRKSPYGKNAKPNSARWENAKCNKCEKVRRKKREKRRGKGFNRWLSSLVVNSQIFKGV
ncbi:phospholipase A1 1 [Bactrocera tryoni]|uniref:phospholipase A1 1 n=1 Tax=Bactrocera tryoni TaxID=59916 RepID=UPI001A980CD6|nr:phospholipase A1 1 [Bactrocera tryoni]